MDYASLDWIAKVVMNLGIVGAIFVIWFLDMRRMNQMHETIRALDSLVKEYHRLAEDTAGVIRDNVSVLQMLSERITAPKEFRETLYLILEKLTRIEERLFRSSQDI